MNRTILGLFLIGAGFLAACGILFALLAIIGKTMGRI